MKNFTLLILFFVIITTQTVFGQTGLTGINYQGVARNTNGTVLSNQAIKVKISILSGTANGPVQYMEEHSINTNQLGLFTLQIGKGTAGSGTFAAIPWQNANQFAKVEMALGGGSYSDLGTSQLMSVPFSLFAASGNPGPMGAMGPAGPQGVQGIQGIAGAKGDKGDIGLQGATGPIGPMGIPGLPGPQGIQGTKGDPGIQGPVGPVGPIGPQGIQGLPGPQGIQGAKGDPGIQGPAGANGVLTGPAGGDLSGNYPNPVVANLQTRPIAAAAPALNDVLRFNGASWAPAAIGGGAFILPYTTTINNVATLFSINNTGDGTSIEGTNATTTASIAAVRGVVTSTTPGGFSTAVRGINNGTGGLGIGVWGSQAGSGWGVYGNVPDGLAVYGNASGAGFGLYGNSNNGTGIFGTSTNGVAANFSLMNNANASNVINASTVGGGSVVNASTSGGGNVINASTTGGGNGINSTATSGTGVYGSTTNVSAAGILGDNTGGGEAVVGRAKSDISGAVVGRNDGGGAGVKGFITTNTTGTAIGVQGQVGAGGSTGRAGRFENLSMTNLSNTAEVSSNSSGDPGNWRAGSGLYSEINNNNSVAAAIRGSVNTIFGNFGAAAVVGEASGTGGYGGLFYNSNAAGGTPALVASTAGFGNAITAHASKSGNGVESNIDGSGNAIYAWVPGFSAGRAGKFDIFNTASTTDVITVTTLGNGTAGNFKVDNTNGTAAAVKGEVNSIFSNFGTAGVYGLSSGTGGYGGLFYQSNPLGSGPALVAVSNGNGNGITSVAVNNGNGIETSTNGTGGYALWAYVPSFVAGKVARFTNFNTGNTNPVLSVESAGTGNLAIFKSGAAFNNVARIDGTGKGFFNGGAVTGGADLAESFEVTGSSLSYEPGDILIISTSKDRTVEKSTTPYSTLVAGVYATKPGVLLTEEHIDSDLKDQVPMGVIGVIPTKVCLEGGAISRGDLLVTSSTPGVAMKADPDKVKVGQVLGKALESYNAQNIGKIKVLVSIK